jgi:hypothetical protein
MIARKIQFSAQRFSARRRPKLTQIKFNYSLRWKETLVWTMSFRLTASVAEGNICCARRLKMACSRLKGIVGVIAASSLFLSSTGAVAATSALPIQQVSPWAALAVMSGAAPVAALCNGATPVDPNVPPPAGVTPGCVLPVTDVAAQGQTPPAPVPVPPVEPAGGGLGIDPLLLALGAVALGIGLYFLLKGNNNNNNNSPA